MNILKNFLSYCICLFLVVFFYICNFDNYTPKANKVDTPNIEELIVNGYEYIDYVFTSKEVNDSNITDRSISIRSENFGNEFFDNVINLKSMNGYSVNYYDGVLTVEGLIPDFLYDSLFIEADLNNGDNYIFQIKNFKTHKAQNPIDRFIIQTLQHTLKRSISPLDFYLWQHKILNKEVTPVEFIIRIIQDPRLIQELTSPEKFINKIYNSIFLDKISEEELSFYMTKFNEFKENYFMSNYEAYNMILEHMIKSEEFVNRIKELNLQEIESPLTTRYAEVYSDFNKDGKLNFNSTGKFYVMDYNELNRTEVSETTAKIFLNEGFKNKLNYYNVVNVDIPDASVKFYDGKILIEGLEPNTEYRNFTITYLDYGVEKKIFVEKIKTIGFNYDIFPNPQKIDLKYDFLDDFKVSSDDFIKEFYSEFYKINIDENYNDHFKVLFVTGIDKFVKLMNLMNEYDFGFEDEVLISKIYDILFNRLPNQFVLNYWIKNFQQLKIEYGYVNSVKTIVNEMIESYEFKSEFNNAILRNFIILNNRSKKLHNV